ncbi:LacI family DNA-binding transcriptional regulator [Rhizobium sp. P38BS-XIX]|uniref:LacI family DNA-binding transcriptional regulator n=1 Tax=Rhizobium sp. P38BS-XIX TaxID=2726740 RepID=UPI0014571007|nr:LacI family DNA-binding transcriptional regulator [Rhizobium sp. P38BS-XIX]NLS01734.1 LacI family DNA-binding transcriptional regulator [Rhizobium sp. P38BS-XIX]
MTKRDDATITLKDVAEAAGVSGITVSRVLRASGPISEATRKRVLEAVKTTGYVHNRLAGVLASARSNLVGVILPSLSNGVFPEVMAGINEALAQSGFQPVVGVTDYDLMKEETVVRSMLSWKPAAIILTGLQHSRNTRRMLEDTPIRVIEIMDAGGRPIDVAIGLSHRDAGSATAQHLIEKGYRRFGYIGPDLERDLRAHDRHEGFRHYLTRHGIAAPVEYLSRETSSISGGKEGLAELLRMKPDLDVVVFSSDDMAIGGVYHCIATGIQLKTQLGIFGFNGLDTGQSLPQPLSTIRSNRHRIGQIAVETFINDVTRPLTSKVIDTGFSIIHGETA